MGNTAESYKQRFYQRYQFIEVVNDENYGQVKVYRKKEINYDYVMILNNYIDQGLVDAIQEQLRIIQESFLKQQSPMLLKIYNFQVRKKNLSSCQIPVITVYIQYLNFTLKNFLQTYKKNSQFLTYYEFIYIITSVISTYQFFLGKHTFIKGINHNILNFNINSIFLTTQGVIKFSPINIKQFIQQNNSFCKALCTNSHSRQNPNFQKPQRLFINDLKRFISQILSYCIYSYQSIAIKKLQHEISLTKTINQLKKILPQNKLQSLLIDRKHGFKTEQSCQSKDGDYLHILEGHNQQINGSTKRSMKHSHRSFV